MRLVIDDLPLHSPVRFGRESGKVFGTYVRKNGQRMYEVELKGGAVVACPRDCLRRDEDGKS